MILLSAEDVAAVLDPPAAAAAVEAALEQQARGRTRLPARLTTDVEHGWLRLMPGDLGDVFGAKLMNLQRGHGIRYQLLLFDGATGETLALMDASVLTQMRTAAVAAACIRRVLPRAVEVAGLFGTGFEARGLLRALPGLARRVRVYSPNPAHREAFAAEMRDVLPVEAVDAPEDAARGLPLVALATRSAEPVLDGGWLDPGTVVVSMGSTRPDLREVDAVTVGRARPVVVDQVAQALNECGDLIATGATADDLVELHRMAPPLGSELTLFKPSGTALQDLAVARVVYERCRERGLGLRVEGLLACKAR